MPRPTHETQLPSEDLLWEGLSFPILTGEELAKEHAADGYRVHFHNGVWWTEVKPFFSMPCDIHTHVDQINSRPRLDYALGGYMHLSAPNSYTNAIYKLITSENVMHYSISNLSRNRQRHVRHGLSNLKVRPVERLEQLLTDGHEVYLSWHQRAKWGADKTNRPRFEAWITRVFHQPKKIILGAYRGNKLIAFMLPNAVGNTACPCFVASRTDCLSYGPNDALFHAFLCIARQTKGVHSANLGTLCSKPSLNHFKLHYGDLKSLSSYVWINPMIRPIVHRWMTRRYPWLGLSSVA